MNRFCERCERVTVDGNLWCERVDCPAELGYPVFEYGEFLGDLKVVKLIRVWRTAALYEAVRGEKKVLLKVAHKGDDCEERVKREAVALASINPKPSGPAAFIRSFFPSQRSILPVPLPPYPVPSKRPFGEFSFRGDLKFFSVFDYIEGKLLSDLMLENPQIWHYQAAWIIETLAQALRPIAAKGKAHLCLTPDMVMVEQDKEGILRPMLLDLGFIVGGNEIESLAEWPRLCEPGYSAPELLAGRPKSTGPAADVYSLGAIFFEMLAGKTAFDSKVRRDEKIREAVTQHRGSLPVQRPELEHAGVVKIVDQSLGQAGRFKDAAEMSKALRAIYAEAPPEKRSTPTRTYVVRIVLVLLLLVVAVITAVLLIQVYSRR